MATATIVKTVKLEFVTAPLIRCQAKKDMPEVGILAGSIFYLVRSSKDNGEYYISTWNYERMMWQDTCPATISNCRHNRAVSADCHKAHSLFSYKPTTPCKGDVPVADKAATFASLFKKYDYRQQEVAPLNNLYASQVEAIMRGETVKVAPGAFCLAR
jgi:hypothetical protein